ncbi:hypothetical protein FYW06_13965 [Bacillus paranthracis]|uniref:Uncharacterized protein n=1 Tax=Bacillus paranthracis TaxID=2026186 RepID=A0A5M9GY86_9BACI|nr:hypothetical protein FYW06_13965 [Bacillus paranthracis]KAB7638609.1 hypothetical protein GBN96_10295 [Bacillus sp. B4-WWTP-NA-D-NA-NA]MBE7108330.1 hypothetical protein [Bacillus paranthracis]MBE7140927.1 hypothetical protein [Bacillus paranthracis]MBR9738713.1 hypothetical protein [Bacillus paranthracis]
MYSERNSSWKLVWKIQDVNHLFYRLQSSITIPPLETNTPEKEFYVQRKNPVENFKILTRDYN